MALVTKQKGVNRLKNLKLLKGPASLRQIDIIILSRLDIVEVLSRMTLVPKLKYDF